MSDQISTLGNKEQMQPEGSEFLVTGVRKKPEVPIWKKSNLTLEEAAAYSGIGINKLRKLSDDNECQFVLWNGSKRLIKRRKLDEYTDGRSVL